jgi:hypothetical protein
MSFSVYLVYCDTGGWDSKIHSGLARTDYMIDLRCVAKYDVSSCDA